MSFWIEWVGRLWYNTLISKRDWGGCSTVFSGFPEARLLGTLGFRSTVLTCPGRENNVRLMVPCIIGGRKMGINRVMLVVPSFVIVVVMLLLV